MSYVCHPASCNGKTVLPGAEFALTAAAAGLAGWGRLIEAAYGDEYGKGCKGES